MQNMVDLAQEKALEQKATRIHRINLLIGESSGVVIDALRFAFEAVTEGTMAENAELSIQSSPVVAFCSQCDKKVKPQPPVLLCPNCGQVLLKIHSGRELQLTELEVS